MSVVNDATTHHRPEVSDVRQARTILDRGYPLYVVCTEDVQEIADQVLGRELSREELEHIEDRLHLNWAEEVELLIEWKLK